MIIKNNNEQALIKGAEIRNFGLNVDTSVFVQMLTKWYSNPESSVVRELLSNAYDSTIESNTSKPCVVGIEGDKFFVQDFGEGMSPEFMNNEVEIDGNKVGYLTIGYSTKKQSSDTLGNYGLGN